MPAAQCVLLQDPGSQTLLIVGVEESGDLPTSQYSVVYRPHRPGCLTHALQPSDLLLSVKIVA